MNAICHKTINCNYYATSSPDASLLALIQCLLLTPDFRALLQATRKRQRQAFRPGTTGNQRAQFRLYLAFCIHYGLRDIDPTPQTICMYAEFLTRTFTSPKSIRNYISGVRLLHKYAGASSTALDSFPLELLLRALDITIYHVPNQRSPVTVQSLARICEACMSLGTLGTVVRCALLLGFFGMLRQSNLAPRSTSSFDPTRHTCRGDVLEHPPGLVVILKWSKVNQTRRKQQLVPIPALSPQHPLCPVAAYKAMLAVHPTTSPNDPLLLMPGPSPCTPLTIPQLATCFRAVAAYLGYSPRQFSLHSLRRGGATAAFEAGINFTHIKRHGGWASDAFWQYISPNTPDFSALATPLGRHVETVPQPSLRG